MTSNPSQFTHGLLAPLRSQVRRRSVVIAVLLVTLSVAACGRPPGPAETTSPPVTATTYAGAIPTRLPVIDPAQVDTSSGEAVALAVMSTAYTWLPGVDSSPNDAMVRAAPLLDDTLAGAVREWSPPTGPGAEWNSWAEQGAFVEATATISTQTHLPDGDTVMRYLRVEQTARTKTGTLSVAVIVVLVTVIRTPAGWRLATYTQL